MKPFDCLARDCPLFGPHLLEASAGTGKTFSIEHIYVRLILESIEVEQILAVTFTRAATRELKARIRTNLEKALWFIRSNEAAWDYLQPYLGSDAAIRNLTHALAGFDRCQIFTIHGFCYRMLKEFAFEAKMSFALSDPDEGRKIPKRLKEAASDFLENGIDESLLCLEQMGLLTKQFESVDAIADRLLRLEDASATPSFSELFAKCKAALHLKVERVKLLEDFHVLEKNYKVVKGDLAGQVAALAELEDPKSLRMLIKERGSLFDFLDPSNRKVRAKDPEFLHYPGFFDWARLHIGPLLKQKVLPTLQGAWNPIAKKILSEEEYLEPDEILARMKKGIENESFAALIRKKYSAAIIDEFQDTDAVQWDIFQRLFLEGNLRALYLVGDPKQSIYRFRKADVYTYLKARDFLGEEHLYQLDTNFRSSKSLIGALNALFARDWLHLPKANRTIPCLPVKAGAKVDSTFPDEKGALHFVLAEGEALFDEAFLPFAVSEIERLQLTNCAILVKDRYQAERALELLKSRGIAAVAKSHTPLGQTVAFQAIRELFEAILSPRDQSAAKIAMAGPFAKPEMPFSEYKVLLEEKGLVPFAREFRDLLDADGMQIFELLFAWEKKEGFSFEGLKRFLKGFRDLDAEEGGRRRMEVDEEAVQVMTLHISKGLEFDVVFALGLASRTPETDEEVAEIDAEKQRQLYVAMTRAKRRLYVPVALSKKDPAPGTHSPMELFCRHLDPLLEHLTALSKTESITFEYLSVPVILGPCLQKERVQQVCSPLLPRRYTPSFLSSFTTLAQTKEIETKWTESVPDAFTLQTMPRGAETGIIIHELLEKFFSSPKSLWKDPLSIAPFVEEQLRFSPLAPWIQAIQQMVRQTITLPLQVNGERFSLSEIDEFQTEVEFVYPTPPHFVKGFIDLIFCHRGKVYFIDWKTNWLERYDLASLQAVMDAHDYTLQSSLYSEAIQRHYKMPYGGAFYLFIRGSSYTVIY